MLAKRAVRMTLACVLAFATLMTIAGSLGRPLGHQPTPRVAQNASLPLEVGIINEFTESKLTPSVGLDPVFAVRPMTPADFLQNLTGGTRHPDVIVFANCTFTGNLIAGIRDYLDGRAGKAFIVLGSRNETDVDLLQALGLLSAPTANPVTDIAIWDPKNASHPLVKDVNWKAVPEVRSYTNVSWDAGNIDTLVQASGRDDPLLVEARNYPGRLVILSPWISSTANRDFELCLHFNYFNYRAVSYLTGRPVQSYVDWPYSPVPHAADQMGIFLWLLAIAGAGMAGFLLMRRHSKRPLSMGFMKKVLDISRGRKEREEGLGNDIEKPEITGPPPATIPQEPPENAAVPEEQREDTSSEWQQVGMHRQISQFFFNLILSFLVAVPGLVMSLYIYPNFIQPYPQVIGWQSVAGNLFGVLWTLTDLGVGAAVVKYFAEYRVRQPQRAVKFLQLLVWWWILSGIIKSTVVTIVGMHFFTQGDIAHLAWIAVLIAIQQFPGCAGIISISLEGMQRYDYKVLCDVVGGTIINTGINYGVIVLCRALFEANPVYGAAFGTVVGLYVGGIVTTWTGFLYYSLAFKKLGFRLSTLFRADFGASEVKEALNYGWKLAAGSIIVPFVTMLEMILIAQYVLNYSAELGYWNTMAQVTNFVSTASVIFINLRAGISEAHGNGKLQLVKYYCTEGIHYINVFTFVLFGALISIGGEVLVGFTGPFWAPAKQYLVILCIGQVIGIYSGVGDTIFQGTGFTKYQAYVWILEQSVRAGLLLLIFTRVQPLWAIMLASIPAVIVKEVVMFAIIRKKIVRFDLAWVHNFIAPALAAVVIYLFANLLLWVIGTATIFHTILLFLVTVFSCLFLYLFFLGFFGGWDDNTLKQFERGLNVVSMVGKFFRTFYKTAEYGHRCCPWKNRFRVGVFDAAMVEARALTAEKRKLII